MAAIPSRSRPPVVLLGGEAVTVSAARSLHADGVRVYALGARTDPVRRSRACHSFTDLGAYEGVQERWLEWLAGGPKGAVLLPCNDDSLELLARQRPLLEELGYLLAEADDEVLLAMLDKSRTYELAEAAQIPVPRWRYVRNGDDAQAAAETFEFPCALKPLNSTLFASYFGLRKKVLLAERPEDLFEGFAQTRPLGMEMMVTEIVPGPDHAYFSYYSYIDERGEPLFHFTKQKLRQWPTRFGLACYEITNWNPAAADVGLRFFQGVGLRGVGNVEFKRDARDGQLKLIECNHRFTAANELVRQSGLDIPLFSYRRIAGLPTPDMRSYRHGVRLWNPVEDVRALLEYRKRGELTVRGWGRSLLHRQHFPMLRIDDPLPSAVSFATKLRRLKGRISAGAGLRRSLPPPPPGTSSVRG
jgi:D-aspartate ligase